MSSKQTLYGAVRRALACAGAGALIAAPAQAGVGGHEPVGPPGDGLVRSIVAAPVTPDGTVAGRVTDLVINLRGSTHPSAPGRSLLAGRQIRIHLPRGFTPIEPPLPFLPGASPGCPLAPAGTPLGACNLVALLQGWPQRPILPLTAISSAYESATSTITSTATQDIIASPPGTPGIKQIHLLLSGFRNPRPGWYRITVEAETGPDGTTETGAAWVHIVARPRPAIALTSVFNPGRPSPIHQTTAPGAEIPAPYDLLLWDRHGNPLTGVTVSDAGPHLHLLVRRNRAVGYIRVQSPPTAEAQHAFSTAPSFEIAAPITGVPTARLNVRFRAGSANGSYALTFGLFGGNTVTTFVRAE